MGFFIFICENFISASSFSLPEGGGGKVANSVGLLGWSPVNFELLLLLPGAATTFAGSTAEAAAPPLNRTTDINRMSELAVASPPSVVEDPGTDYGAVSGSRGDSWLAGWLSGANGVLLYPYYHRQEGIQHYY